MSYQLEDYDSEINHQFSVRETHKTKPLLEIDSFMISLIIGVIIAITLALLLGILFNLVVPRQNLASTDITNAVIILYLHVIALTVVTAAATLFFLKIFGQRLSTYFTLNIFVVILFLTQQQIFVRLSFITRHIFGIQLSTPSDVNR